MEKSLIEAKRPLLLTILCWSGIVWSLLNFVLVFSPVIKKIGIWAPAIYGLVVALQFISFIGVFHMKRWGVLLFVTSFFAKLLFTISNNDVSYYGIGAAVIFTIILLVFYPKMSGEL